MIQKGEGFEIPVESETEPDLEEPGSGETATDEVDETDGANEARSLEEAVDHLKRLQAEFDNFRKRVNRERMETVAWVQRDMVEKLLPAGMPGRR